MKREIKFRVWNGMEMEYNITCGKFGTFFVNPEKGDGLNPDDTACLSVNTTKYFEDTPVMQFTGFKDKHGKDIYEGDIYNMGDLNILYVVVWLDAGLIGKQIGSSSYAGIEHWKERIEIVGNIHDNPELIK